MKYHVLAGGADVVVDIAPEGAGLRATTEGESRLIDIAVLQDGKAYSLVIEGRSVDVSVEEHGQELHLLIGGTRYVTEVLGEREFLARSIQRAPEGGESAVRAVMTGIVREVRVAKGDVVRAGQVLFILEAMKMENEVKAAVDGTVTAVHVETGATVERGVLVVEIDAA